MTEPTSNPYRESDELDEVEHAVLTGAHQRNRWILIAVLLLLCLGIGVRRFLIANGSDALFTQPSSSNNPAQTATPSPTPEAGLTVLLMGRGGAGHDGGALADTIVIARILETQKRIILLSIPRDLWVSIPFSTKESEMGKINSSYAIGIDSRNYADKKPEYSGEFGGGTLAKDVVATVTGLHADKYVTVDFSGFEQAVDTIGGVDVTVDKTFSDFEYPITGRETLDCSTYTPAATGSATTVSEAELISYGQLDANTLPELPKQYPCRYELLHFDAGKQHMSGAVALKYVRSRHSNEDGNDFARSRRQKILLQAVADKLFSIGAITKIPSFFTTLRSHIDTDLSTTDILALLPKAQEYRGYAVTSLTLSTDNYLGQGYTENGQFELFPLAGLNKYEAIQDWVQATINPSKPIRYPTIELTGNWKNASGSASLKDSLNAAGFPTKAGQLIMKNATTSATLFVNRSRIDPASLEKIKQLAGVSDQFVQTASSSMKISTDIQILHP